jgi:hypothetical protein
MASWPVLPIAKLAIKNWLNETIITIIFVIKISKNNCD